MRELPSIRMLPVALLITGLYLFLHPYQGLIHDARLYTLQALNHLHPDLYSNDVFLKYGSQDSYTLFTPVYAVAISLFGAEHAASLFTFVSVIALLIAAWSFARALMPARFAWLGLGMLVVTPGFYGSGITFAVFEEFITPRLLAEALVLFALTAWMRERRVLSAILLLAGFLLHPIMTFPALILIAVMGWGLSHWRKLWPLLLVAAVMAAVALAGALPLGHFQFDPDWWPMADRVPHLIIGHWTLHDWARITTLFSTLVVGALCLAPVGQRLAVSLLITCAGTLLLSWIGGDLLKIVLIVQGQAWRSLWLATAVAALLLPWIAASFWQEAGLRRCSVLLLITAWALGPMSVALYFSILAMITALCGNARIPARYARFAALGAGILLAVAILSMLALTWSELDRNGLDTGTTGVVAQLYEICADRLLPAAALVGVWWAVDRIRDYRVLALLTAIAVLPILLMSKASAADWLNERYSRKAHDAFAEWRALIPPGSDVLWATKFVAGSDPTAAWLLLERPSYYSSVQVNSGLFSRPAAMELLRRGKEIPLSLPTEMPVDIKFDGELAAAPSCSTIPTRYIVTNVAIPDAQLVSAPAALGAPFDSLQLHICP